MQAIYADEKYMAEPIIIMGAIFRTAEMDDSSRQRVKTTFLFFKTLLRSDLFATEK